MDVSDGVQVVGKVCLIGRELSFLLLLVLFCIRIDKHKCFLISKWKDLQF